MEPPEIVKKHKKMREMIRKHLKIEEPEVWIDSMLEKIKSVKDTVQAYLTQSEAVRDSDNLLIASIWYKEADIANNPDMSAKDFLNFLANGKVTNSEAIRRARQKVQEQEPSLRGRNYKGRMAEEQVVRSGIKEV